MRCGRPPASLGALVAVLSWAWAQPPQSHEFLRLVINSIKNDITSRNDTYQSLGLVFVANGARQSVRLSVVSHVHARCAPQSAAGSLRSRWRRTCSACS